MRECCKPIDSKPPETILVICLAGVGDVLMATPLLRELRLAYPSAAIDVLVMQTTVARDILAGNPNINEVYYFNFMTEPILRSLAFCKELRRRRYDCSLTTMPQNRLEYNLVTWLLGAKKRIGFKFVEKGFTGRSFFLTRSVPERPEIHLVENNLRLLSEGLGVSPSEGKHRLELVTTEDQRRFAREFLAERSLSRPLIGFHPGSGTTKNLALRRWAPEKWAGLARLILKHDPAVRIVMFGAKAEQPLRDEILRLSEADPGRLISADRGDILQSAALIGEMDCFVCCDTLLTHVAAAMQVPTVEILGPTDLRSIYPYGVEHRIVRTGLECSPCYGYSRKGIECTNPVFMKCLRDVTPEMVFEAVTVALRRNDLPLT